MQRKLWITLVAIGFTSLPASMTVAETSDPRDVSNGHIIPDEGYCDQPYVVVLPSGKWLCVLTTGAGKEGQTGQHVVSTTSTDHGRTWTKPIDIEPADGPEASWVTPLLVPSGRVYAFYDYNGDQIKELRGKPARADMLGWYCYRYTDDEGKSWSAERHRLPLRLTDCDRANDWQGRVQIFWGISKPITVGDSAIFAFTKLGKYILDNGEGWFYRSDNILSERDPAKLRWSLLPEGERGVRDDKFGSVQEEHNIVSLGGDDLYCVYRTTTGNPCQSYSRDGGRTWSTPEVATYAPGGRPIKHPRACPKLWQTSNGKYLLWYHNHGGHDFKGRNPAWIIGGVVRDGLMYWSQPEILLYDEDLEMRMSYPDLIEQNGRYWITETQKTVARVHEVDRTLLEGLWRQVEAETASPAPVRDAAIISLAGPSLHLNEHRLPPLPRMEPGRGFSVEIRVRTSGNNASGVLVESISDSRGWKLVAETDGHLRIELHDGPHHATWSCDRGRLSTAGEHHIIVMIDGGPKTITFVVDGVVADGGTERETGWGRFDSRIVDVGGNGTLNCPRTSGLQLVDLRVHARPLRNFEAVENLRATTPAQR